MKSEHLSSGLMKQLAFQSDTTRAAEDQPKATKYFQSQDPFDSVSSLEQVQGTEVLDMYS